MRAAARSRSRSRRSAAFPAGYPLGEGLLTDAELATDIGNRRARLRLAQG